VLRDKKTQSWAWGALAATYREESDDVAISLYAQGILSAHEDSFILPQLAAIAILLVKQESFEIASMVVKRAVRCYEDNGWRVKPSIEQLTLEAWYDSSVEPESMQSFLRERAEIAQQYLYDSVYKTHGLVTNLHKSGKGLHLYLSPGDEVATPLSVMSKGSQPALGDFLEVRLAECDGTKVVLAAKACVPVGLEGVSFETDSLRTTDKGFGFVGDTFVPAHLIGGYKDGDILGVLRCRSYDKKKSQYGWKAIKIHLAP
jgi:hypothetical protein